MEKDKDIKDIENINVFEQTDYLTFILKKAEKIVTAIYLVTNLFPMNDPLKQTLREKSLCLLSDVNYIRQNFDSTNIRFVINLDSSVLNILSLLNVARDTRLISAMNFSILETEIKNLAGSEFNNNKVAISEVVFGDKFFENKNEQNIINPKARLESFDTEGNKQVGLISLKDNKSLVSFKKDSSAQAGKIAQNKEISRRVGQKQQEAKEKRRTLIKNLMKSNKFIMIKDVMKLMKDCSEKTIQRELNSMVVEKAIKREGTRRWSKYYPI
ncbi:MAG: Uncharacterized protein Athens071416_387 [Parcubacteria group bacterium Athens0714_16]|nr:MAG: Uncharacterized protein Athens071416_387 [Parcubacteria group bacterium Athens0714_16]